MSKTITIIGIAAVVVVSGLLLWARSKGRATAATGGASSASGPQLLWKFKSDKGAVTSVTLGPGGTIYAGTNNAIYSISPDGTQKWKTQLAGMLYPAAGTDGELYVTSSSGFLIGVSSEGKPGWTAGMGMISFGGPPAIGTDDTVIVANSVSDLFAFRPRQTTAATWSQNTVRQGIISTSAALPGRATTSTTPSRNSPAIWRDETVVLSRQHWLHSFDPDGTPEWINELTAGTLGQVALADDGAIYVIDDQGTLFAVGQHGNLKWTFEGKEFPYGSPVISMDGTVYFVTDSAVHAIAADGTVKWETKSPERIFTSPTLAADGTIYVGSTHGLLGFRPDGSLKFNFHTMSATGAPNIGSDGTIYYACGYAWVCAVRDEDSPLMPSAWPKTFHDPANTGHSLTKF